MKLSLFNSEPGFTLIEVVIASAIFATVAVVGTAVLAGTYKAQSQINTTRSRQETVRSTLEIISREVRFSKSIEIDPTSNILTIMESDNSKKIFYVDASVPDQKNLVQQKVSKDGSNDGLPVAVNPVGVSIVRFDINGLSTSFNSSHEPIGGQAYVFVDISVKPISDVEQRFESSIVASPRGYYER